MIDNSVMIVMVVVILMLKMITMTTTTTMMMMMMMTIVWRGRAVVGPEPAGFGWERHARLRLATNDGPTQRFIARLHWTSCFLHAENILLCRNMVSSNHNFSFNFCVTKKVNLNFGTLFCVLWPFQFYSKVADWPTHPTFTWRYPFVEFVVGNLQLGNTNNTEDVVNFS